MKKIVRSLSIIGMSLGIGLFIVTLWILSSISFIGNEKFIRIC